MKRYAVILLETVIDIVVSSNMPKYPPDEKGNKVITMQCEDTVTIGMMYNEKNGTFYEYTPQPPEPYQPTEGELMIMETQATMYEEMQESKLSQMKANADIYEAILSNGGNI